MASLITFIVISSFNVVVYQLTGHNMALSFSTQKCAPGMSPPNLVSNENTYEVHYLECTLADRGGLEHHY